MQKPAPQIGVGSSYRCDRW